MENPSNSPLTNAEAGFPLIQHQISTIEDCKRGIASWMAINDKPFLRVFQGNKANDFLFTLQQISPSLFLTLIHPSFTMHYQVFIEFA